MRTLTLDFETQAIGPRPQGYPPEPVGVALLPEGGPARYLAWGHPTGNGTTAEGARREIQRELDRHDAVLCHNAPFDVAVMEERVGVSLAGHRLLDSLVVAFMVDPYSPTLGLKALAARHLGTPPEERDAVRGWLIEHGLVRASASRGWGAYIAQAPADVVGRYAVGDVERTRALHDALVGRVDARAYAREMDVARACVAMERRGVLLDVGHLEADVARFEGLLARMRDWLRVELRAPALVFTEDDALARAVESRYGVELPRTATGRRSTSKDTLAVAVPDARVRAALRWEASMQYNLSTYMRPFLEQASRAGRRVHAQWNAVRGDARGGARTGRMSSSPNMQNLKDAEGERRLLQQLDELYSCAWEVPSIRSYVIPPDGHWIIGRDYSQIELRVAAHFEDGPILERYRAQPDMDLHQWVVDIVRERHGVDLPRRIAKNIGFGILYGAGAGAIAQQSGLPLEEAREMRSMYLRAMPSLRELMSATQERGRSGGFITTLGGRRYPAEPARVIAGERRTFEYKLLNYLIQGSAADILKGALVRAMDAGLDVRLNVHDELVCYSDSPERDMATLREAMEHCDEVSMLDCPVLTSGYRGRDWANAEDVL